MNDHCWLRKQKHISSPLWLLDYEYKVLYYYCKHCIICSAYQCKKKKTAAKAKANKKQALKLIAAKSEVNVKEEFQFADHNYFKVNVKEVFADHNYSMLHRCSREHMFVNQSAGAFHLPASCTSCYCVIHIASCSEVLFQLNILNLACVNL